MGRREVRVIVVRKSVAVALLVIVSAALVALVYYLSGRAYASGYYPIRDLILGLGESRHPLSRDALLASLMPVFADVLLFVPWGFLLFVVLDRPGRPRSRTYALTFLAGLAFAGLLDGWQHFLPTRVTDSLDTIANAFGAMGGALAGHLRKQVRIQFDY
jgi:hypothetical protein